MRWFKLVPVVLVFISVILLPGQSMAVVSFPPQAQLKVGALVPLTGRLAEIGQTAVATLEVSKDDFQKNYPVTMELVIEDTGSDPVQALQKLQVLQQQGIRVVVGPFGSEEVSAVLPFANQNQILLISPTSTAPSLAQDDMLFRVSGDDTKQALAMRYYVQDRQYQAVLPVYRDDQYGRELYEQFKTQFEAAGGEILKPVAYPTATQDFQPVVAEVQATLEQNAGKSVAVFAICYDEIVDLFKAANGNPVLASVPWLGADATSKSDAIAHDPAAAAFAMQTQFTASISTPGAMAHPYLPFLFYVENMISKVRQVNDSILETYVGAISDALWLAGIAMSDPAEPVLKKTLTVLSQDLLGFTGAMDFNAEGDRPYCFFGFFRLTELNGAPLWKEVASFRISKYGAIQPYQYREFAYDGRDLLLEVGLLLPMTGENASMGVEIESAMQKARADINKVMQRYYTLNSRVEFRFADTQSDPDVALAKVKEMHQGGIDLFIGPISSVELEAVAPYVNANEILLISPSSTALSMAQDDNIFRLALDDNKQSKALAALVDQEGYTRVDVLYIDNSYGRGFHENFKTHFTALGNECGDGVAYAPGTSDFGPVLAQLEAQAAASVAAAGAAKTAVLMVSYDEGITVFETLAASNSILSTLRWFGTDGIANNPLFASHPIASAMAVNVNLTASILGTHTGHDTLFYTQSFQNDMADALGRKPSAYDIAAYDALWVFTSFPVSVDWDHSIPFTDLRAAFITILNKSTGYLNVNFVNAFGDRLYANIDFYQMKQGAIAKDWNRVATYEFFMGPEILTYLDEEAASQTVNWDLFQ
ncbi:MAG: penicillin-binding protein activator [bacterium]|nr:penicillin-binding protein activator [bacterium]